MASQTKRGRNWELGYRHGFAGIFNEGYASISEQYADGWDVGNCDRPSLEELSMDVEKERTDPLGF